MPDQVETTEIETIKIPIWNQELLEKELGKLNKKAAKIGCPLLRYELVKRFTTVAPGYERKAKLLGEEECPKVEWLEIKFIGEGPKIDGWKFLGTLDHNTLPGSVIINTVPGEEIPQQFHDSDATCDHCGKIRRRNATFIMQEDDTGDYKRVGRQCVRDFIGWNPNQVMNFLTSVHKFVDGFQDEERWFSGGGDRFYTYDGDDVLAKTAAIINAHGWVPRSAVDADNPATAGRVLDTYFPPSSRERVALRQWHTWMDSLDLKNEKWLKEAKDARVWLKEQGSDNEYFHNLHTIDNADKVPAKLFGYWCSVMSSYQRAQERLRLAEREKKLRLNEHIGDIKERLTFTVTLQTKRAFDGAYGIVRLHRFTDAAGRTLVWWANVDPDMEVNGQYEIKGTIKKHEEHEGWKQTVLTRVKVEKRIEKEEAA